MLGPPIGIFYIWKVFSKTVILIIFSRDALFGEKNAEKIWQQQHKQKQSM